MAKKHPNINQFHYDLYILFPVILLVGIGIVMIYSASSVLAFQRYGTDYYFFKKQVIFAILGIVALFLGRYFPYKYYRYLAYPGLLIAIAMMLLLQIDGFGVKAGGATRWLHIAGLSFQPSEIVRVAVVIYLAYSLSKKQDRVKEFNIGVLPHLIVVGLFGILIFLEPDFGSAVILCSIAWAIMFVGGARIKHLLCLLPLLIPIAIYMVIKTPYRLNRILAFSDPWKHATDVGYQSIQSHIAFGSGGIVGAGIGKGIQKLFYLPEPHTDFIFSVIGEELGLIGVFFIILLYLIIVMRGIVISKNMDDSFGTLLAIGMTMIIGLQVCVNISVTLGLLPTKGMPLPFLSYGGTSLFTSMAVMGILLNLSASRKG